MLLRGPCSLLSYASILLIWLFTYSVLGGSASSKHCECSGICFAETGLYLLDVQEKRMLFCYPGWIGIVIQTEQ